MADTKTPLSAADLPPFDPFPAFQDADPKQSLPSPPPTALDAWSPERVHLHHAPRVVWAVLLFVMGYLVALFVVDVAQNNDRAVHDAWDRFQFFINIAFAGAIAWLLPKRP